MPTDELLETFKVRCAACLDPPLQSLPRPQALDPEGKGTVSGDDFFRALKIFGGASKFTDQEVSTLLQSQLLIPLRVTRL